MANVTPAGAGVSGPAIYIGGTVVANSTTTYLLRAVDGVLSEIAVSALALDLDVGSTTITSGTTTRILYNNAGVLGEYTISGTGTVVAMTASPTFTGTVGLPAFSAVKANGGSAYGTITNSLIPYTFTLYAADAGNNGFQGLGWLDSTIGPDYGLQLLTGGTLRAFGPITADRSTAIPAGGTLGTGFMFSSTANFGIMFGSGAPNKSAAKGTLYLRSDGSGTNDRAYVATDAAGTWTALVTVA